MASSVPAKSLLHNFGLPNFNWNKNVPRDGGRGGGGGGSEVGEEEGLGEGKVVAEYKRNVKKGLEYLDEKVEKSKKLKVLGFDHGVNLDSSEDKGNEKEPRSRILIKIPALVRNSGDDKVKEVKKEENVVMMDEQRAWNLRPRRPVKKKSNGDDGVGLRGGGGGLVQEKKKGQLQHENSENRDRLRVEKAKKVEFSISLSRQEIEEDIYSLTGSKASRRPTKRAKTVQKHLDNVFPGLWLGSVTPDSYKVPEHSMMG